jgi:hypothetical protein
VSQTQVPNRRGWSSELSARVSPRRLAGPLSSSSGPARCFQVAAAPSLTLLKEAFGWDTESDTLVARLGEQVDCAAWVTEGESFVGRLNRAGRKKAVADSALEQELGIGTRTFSCGAVPPTMLMGYHDDLVELSRYVTI